MVIERIHIASFGTLEDRELTFGTGINIIEGENESGKTTIAAFLRFLFYGFSGEEEREQYCAFPGTKHGADANVGGWLDCVCTPENDTDTNIKEASHYRVARTLSVGDTSLAGSAEITDLAANARAFEGQEPWQVFFGVPAEVFVSTAFVRQVTASDAGAGGNTDTAFPVGTGVGGSTVRTAMENILSSADAEMNPESAAARLDARKNELYCAETNSGTITELEKQREALAEHLASAAEVSVPEEPVRTAAEGDAEALALTRKIEESRTRIAENDARSAKLESIREKYETYKTLARVGELSALRNKKRNAKRRAEELCETMFRSEEVPDEHFADDLRSSAAEMAEARTAADRAEETLRSLGFSSRRDTMWAQLLARVESDGGPENIRKTVKSLNGSRSRSAVFGALSLLLTVLCLAGSVFLLVVHADVTGLCVLLTVIMGALAMIFLISHSSVTQRFRAVLARYGCKSEEALEHFLDEYGDSQARMRQTSADRIAASAAKKEADFAYTTAADDAAALLRKLQPKGAPPISADRLTPDLVRRASEQLDKALAEIAALDAKADAYEEQIQAMARLLGSDDEDALLKQKEELKTYFGGREAAEINMEPILRELDFNMKANKALVERISLLSQKLDSRRNTVPETGTETDAEEMRTAGTPAVRSPYPGEDTRVCGRLLAELDETLISERRTYHALRLAADALRRAGVSFRESLAPELMKNAGTFLRVVSDGQYAGLSFENGLYLSVPSEEGGQTFPVAYMSAGTQDLAFLCLRMALVSRMFEHDTPPMLFDDAFTGLDDRHLVRVLSLLSSVSEENGTQMFVLTCHKREHRISTGISGAFTFIEL